MSSTTQTNQPLALITAAWKDTLLMAGLSGQEGISQLFQFEFEFVVENEKLPSPLPFHKVVGEPLVARFLQGGNKEGPAETRHFSGICAEFGQGATDEKFTAFRAVVVPKLWLLTRRARSRIFQQLTVPKILEKVLKELLGGEGELSFQLEGVYEPRDYCVQYRETDFNFVSRLMEEEGIFYFFKHTQKGHELVVSDTAKSYPALRPAYLVTGTVASHSAKVGTAVITSWLKRQELRTGKVTLRDHTFELPHKNLESVSPTQGSTKAGKAPHELSLKANSALEIYDWPGEYAQRFDGIAPGGGDRKADVDKVFDDNKRTAKLRMEQQASGAVSVVGGGTWAQLLPGSKMAVETVSGDHRAKFASAEGAYLLTSVTHFIAPGNPYRSGQSAPASYQNQFVAVPFDLPYRPARVSPKPVVHGSQSAVVVGPIGEEIFTDKYGRVKVQFHWDREGKRDADSSCWIRVVHPSAGRAWGVVSIPRIGQEVIVDFLEGDPDQPIVVGCVFNPDQMPMYKLPQDKTKTYLRTNSSPGGVGYNALRFEDKAGEEQIYVHGQKNMDTRVRNDSKERIGNDRHMRVGFHLANDHKGDTSGESKTGTQYEEVAIDQHLKVHKNQDEHIGGDVKLLIGGGDGDGNLDVHVKKSMHELIDDTFDQHILKAVAISFDDTLDHTVAKDTKLTYESKLDVIVGAAVQTTYSSTYDQTISSAAKQTYGSTLDVMTSGQRTETVGSGYDLKVASDRIEDIGGSSDHTIGMNLQQKIGMKMAVDAGQEIHLKGGMKVVIEAPTITLKGAGGFITIGPAGVAIQGTLVLINSGGAAIPGSGSAPKSPKAAKQSQAAKNAKKAKDAKDAKPIKPIDADVSSTGAKSN